MIHVETPEAVYDARNIPFWLLSAFKSGFINSAGFLLSGEFVSHITGFGTRVGVSLGHQGYFMGLELFIIPIAFIAGGSVTALMLDKKLRQGEIPSYYKTQGLITLLIGVLIALGESNLINDQVQFLSDDNYSGPEFLVLGLLCFICGLKNGLVSWTTKGKIRVTHLTGLGTDIGLNLPYMFRKDQLSPRFNETSRINVIRIMILVCFSVGAMTSAMLFPQLGWKCFFIVFFISLIMTLVSIVDTVSVRQKNSAEEKVY